MTEQDLHYLRSLLPASNVFEKGAPGYKEHSAPWSTSADQHPNLVLQPPTLESMCKVVKSLYESNLDFAVRNTGTGSASAKDVIVSTQGFKDFAFDKQSETVTLGSGFSWGEVDELMEERAPGYQLPSADAAGHEYGLMSDPQNLLDAQIVLRDGQVVWASEEPDLMWALRGGGGNFGVDVEKVVTALKFRARPYSSRIFIGVIFIPYSSLHETSEGVATMAARPTDPKVATHVMNRGSGMGEPPQGARPGIAVFMYDAYGEEHGRSEDGFAWAFRLPGAVAHSVQETNLRTINAMVNGFLEWQGNNMFWLSAPLLSTVDEKTLIRAWKWWEDCINIHEGFQDGSTVLLEFMQEGAMSSSGGRAKTAWPHHGRRHVMQLVLGCKPESAPPNTRDLVMKQFAKAGREIAGPNEDPKEFHAGFLHDWNILTDIHSDNFDKLKEIKRRYDPRNRFNKAVDLTDAKPGVAAST